MPVRRDADGNIIDERTTPVWRSDRPAPPGSRSAVDITAPPDFRGAEPTTPVGEALDDRYGRPTERAQGTRPGEGPRDVGGGHTRVIRRGDPDAPEIPVDDPMNDPPVGWLVIVDGPGKGHVATLGIGVNSIGRDAAERVSLRHGDEMISRVNHGTITYDPKGRKFYVQHGGGKNLTYVNDEPVLAPRELEPLTQVQMGDTVLRFVPLCGAEFSWGDEPGQSRKPGESNGE